MIKPSNYNIDSYAEWTRWRRFEQDKDALQYQNLLINLMIGQISKYIHNYYLPKY